MNTFRNLFLVAALVSGNSLFAAPHPLDQWTARTVPLAPGGFIYSLNSAAFGNGVFVAAGTRGMILTSPDGVTWTDTSPGMNVLWRSVRFLNGQFCVVGHTNQMLRSTDGTNWSTTVLPFGGAQPVCLDVGYGNGQYVVGSAQTYLSSNLVDWVRADPPYPWPPTFLPGFLESVTFGGGKFVLNSLIPVNPVRNAVFHLSSGTNWVYTNGPTMADALGPSRLVYAANRFTLIHTKAGPFSSADGASWQAGAGLGGLGTFTPYALAYGAGYWFIAGPMTGYGGLDFLFYSSTNAVNWERRFPSMNTFAPYAAAFGHGTFVVVGDVGSGARIYQSDRLTVSPLKIHQYAGITLEGVPGQTYRIEASAEADGNWTTLTNLVLPQSPYIWIDYDSPGVGSRVYRVAEAP